jgi:hypothetical protein
MSGNESDALGRGKALGLNECGTKTILRAVRILPDAPLSAWIRMGRTSHKRITADEGHLLTTQLLHRL